MPTVERHVRRWCRVMFLGAGLIGLTCQFATAAESSTPTIETMTAAKLNQMIATGQGRYLFFFTAAWCGHCKAMLPDLNRLHRRFHKTGLRIIGISVDAGNASAMQAVLNDHRVDFPVFWVGEQAIDAYRLVGIPIIFLTRNGQLVEKIPGKCSYTLLEKKVLDLLK